jgi:protein-S-isoprenylcysteine O-methyltransferase Ste14
MNLRSKLIAQGSFTILVAGILFFLPAGTLRYWEAWAYLAIFAIPLIAFSFYFYKHDPEVVRRRMQTEEKESAQKWLIRIATPVCIGTVMVPGFDHRYGWTKHFTGGVPIPIEFLAQAVVLASYLTTMWVIDVNRFAARTVQVEEGQSVVSEGPYGVVRHPMYSAALVMWMASAPALGSYVALPFFALLIPIIVLRLLNEEKVLRTELPGYDEYCQQVPYRLIPKIW